MLHSIEGGLLRMELVGTYTHPDIGRAFLAAIADPACPREVRLLVDVRRSEVLAERSADQIRAVSEFLGPHADRIGRRCAVVAVSDVHYGLTRMGAVFCEGAGVTTRVFREAADALAWLGSPADS